MYDSATFGQGTELEKEETVLIYPPKPAGWTPAFGERPTPEEKTIHTWPGKQALLGTSWQGIMRLGDW